MTFEIVLNSDFIIKALYELLSKSNNTNGCYGYPDEVELISVENFSNRNRRAGRDGYYSR